MRRIKFGRWLPLLLAGLLLTPATSRAQGIAGLEQAPGSPLIPWPIGRPHMEQGGFYTAAEFLYMQQSNPILSQVVAVRGFTDTDGSISGTPGTFVGSGKEALNTNQLAGPGTFEPGIALFLGWKFENGASVELGWWHIGTAHYAASASLVPQNFAVGQQGADSFLFSPVYNFPFNYAGPPTDVNGGAPGSTFGIWNAASNEEIEFFQRFEQVTLNFRIPVDQQDNYRYYGIVGGRAEIMWERFKWTTVDLSVKGVANALDEAYYNNVVSNRWYGADLGCGGDWYLGDTPLGAFSFTAEIQGGLGLDFVKDRANYALGDFSTSARRNINTYLFSPLVQGDIGLMWYPVQGVEVRLGWQGLLIFNTEASTRPIDFNVGAVAPPYTQVIRYFHGLHVGVSFVF